ncbi:hypothetical protein BHM03_00002998 [Ensete ventricosum]|uniref:Uncharacterized protein n=1 Tax=Ensete ventricosum TaxID=4639 RepID=A0A445MA04_ENSVE|nr:hypothetical protein BHM03_00002998 [Ensete ventricosum]
MIGTSTPTVSQHGGNSRAATTPLRNVRLKKLTREELRDRSVKGLCWHYDKPWSCDHYCKKGRLPMIESIEESEEEDLEPEEENMKENP